MIYDFKKAARIPAGVSADGVMTERERIVKDYGKASIAASTNAVMSEPDHFPNLRAFAPPDAEAALEKCISDGIRHAYASVIPMRVVAKEGDNALTREIRVLFVVPDKDGELTYEPIQVIKANPNQRTYLISELRRDAKNFADKLQDLLAELEETV